MTTKTHVFMAINGELILAHPICFLDGLMANDVPALGGYAIALTEHDGYIIENPNYSPISFFLNRDSEKMFEDLGEL